MSMVEYLRGEKTIDLNRRGRCIREDLHTYNQVVKIDKDTKVEEVLTNAPKNNSNRRYTKVVRVKVNK